MSCMFAIIMDNQNQEEFLKPNCLTLTNPSQALTCFHTWNMRSLKEWGDLASCEEVRLVRSVVLSCHYLTEPH